MYLFFVREVFLEGTSKSSTAFFTVYLHGTVVIDVLLFLILPPSCIKSISFSAFSSPINWDPLSKLLVFVTVRSFDGIDEEYVFLGKRLVEKFQINIISRIFYTTNKPTKFCIYRNQKSYTVSIGISEYIFATYFFHTIRFKGTVATNYFLTIHIDTGYVLKNKGIGIDKKYYPGMRYLKVLFCQQRTWRVP
jgi:hypothetical protein